MWMDQESGLKRLDDGAGYNETLREVLDIGLGIARKMKRMPLNQILPHIERLLDGEGSNESAN